MALLIFTLANPITSSSLTGNVRSLTGIVTVKFHEKLSVHILVFKTGHDKVSMEAVLLPEFVDCVEVCTETNLLS